MADAFVGLADDGPGKKVQVYENTVNAQVVEAQAIVLVDSTGTPDPTVKVDGSAHTQPVSGTVAVSAVAGALPAGSAIIGKVTTDQTTHGTTDLVAADITKIGGAALAIGQQVAGSSIPVILPATTITTLTPPTTVTANIGTAGTLATAAKQPALGTAGTASADVISIQGIASMTAVKVDGSAVTQPISQAAIVTGGATPYRYIGAAAANQDATAVKGSAGKLYAIYCGNVNVAVRYLKFYNLASGATSASTPVLSLMIPGNTAGAGGTFPLPACGVDFATGISFRMTTGMADNDANAITANDLLLSLVYQ